MANAPTVAVLATLDTKHETARFVCDALSAAGATPWLVDLALRPHEHNFAALSAEVVAQASGIAWNELALLSRADAAQNISRVAANWSPPKRQRA